MKWLELSTEVGNEAVEAVAEIFSRVGHGGVAIEQAFAISDDPESYTIDPRQPVTVRTYVPLDKNAPAREQEAAEALWHLGQVGPVAPLRTREIAEEDWANAWKQHFHVHRVGEHTVIKPSWQEYTPSEGEVVIELDPGMAFGTGLHPTTRMCLAELERRMKPGMEMLDLGTGSGILAIAAAKSGVRSVLAMDIDPVAVKAAEANVQMNGIAAVVEVREGTLPVEPEELGPLKGAFDLVVANIIASVIVELASSLAAALRPGGLVIASGIIDERLPGVLAAFDAAGCRVIAVLTDDDWRTVVIGSDYESVERN